MKHFALPLMLLLLACCQTGGTLVTEHRECDPSDDARDQKAECDDGDPGTTDRCAPAGTCAHPRAECDPLDPPDVGAAACEDGDPCTAARCSAVEGCLQFQIGNCP